MADGSVHPDFDIGVEGEITTLHDLASAQRWVAWQTEARDGGKPKRCPIPPAQHVRLRPMIPRRGASVQLHRQPQIAFPSRLVLVVLVLNLASLGMVWR